MPSVTGPETTLKNHFISLSLVSMISGFEELCKSNECNENPKQPLLGGQSFNTKTWRMDWYTIQGTQKQPTATPLHKPEL